MDADLDASPTYIGVRKRKWGKWVSEIREPGKKTRIWLGSFETPEMAAVAHDVAAFWLKGQEARLNFPDSTDEFPRPLSLEPGHIRAAALEAALEVKFRQGSTQNRSAPPALQRAGSGSGLSLNLDVHSNFNLFGGDEWGLDSPKLWRELAEAMLIAPPQLLSCELNNEVEFQEQGCSLWEL